LEAQLASILRAWGMPEENIAATTQVMVEADLRGIESHGVTMMTLYRDHMKQGRIDMSARFTVVRENAVTALIDGGGGLGHAPSVKAMQMAIAKARALGVAVVSVRNSNHYGAAGVYASMAADAGLIGISTTAVYNAAAVPTFGARPMFGTNPLAFAAPAGRNPPFLLDMATTTVAIGKLKVAVMQGTSIPEGWATDDRGRPLTDPKRALTYRRMTPLGGAHELGGHKGYGLAAMVEILSTTLGGSQYAPTRAGDGGCFNVGHCFIAIDPNAFRDAGAFESDLDAMIDALHACPPVEPQQPVLVHGDPEYAIQAERRAHGIPLYPDQIDLLRQLSEEAGATFVLRP
jgi:LDH2 family malate/lactate/ureidoglycolate dehydrogenase